MSFYENTLIAKQDLPESELKKIKEKYNDLINNNSGQVVKIEEWGLLNLSYKISKNNKGNFLHFKIKGDGNTISELEKNERIDKNLLRFLTVKVQKFDLNKNYFSDSENEKKDKIKKYEKKV